MHQLSPDLCSGRALHMDFEMLRQPPTDWIKVWNIIFETFQKLLVPEDWTENIFFLNQLLAQSFEPFGDLLNITIVLIIVITSICKSQALNISTSFHFIFYHKLRWNRTTCRDIFNWLPILFQRSRMMPCFLNPGYQESERWGCIPLPAMGSLAVVVGTRGLMLALLCWFLYCL